MKKLNQQKVEMKKFLFMSLLGILFGSCSSGKVEVTRQLEPFNKVNVVGNGQLYLEKSSSHSMKIMAKNESDMENLVTEVRDGELHIFHKSESEKCKTPEYTIYLNHTEISNLNLTGVFKIQSDEAIFQNELAIRSQGILNGSLEVSVKNLDVNLEGISNLSISGHADSTALKITGIGRINTKGLKTGITNHVSKGYATIN